MAANRTTKGDSDDVYLMGCPRGGGPSGAFTSNVAQVSSKDYTQEYDGLSLHLIVDYEQDPISVDVGVDHVVASTGIWTFTNGAFPTLTGVKSAQLVVSGAANAGNNGTFAITGNTATTITTATTGLVNETFGPNVVAFVIRSESASIPTGAWTIQGSNDFVGAGNATMYGQPSQPGHLPDITALFSGLSAVTDASSQIIVPTNGNVAARVIQATFTPTAGRGTARVARFGKSWAR